MTSISMLLVLAVGLVFILTTEKFLKAPFVLSPVEIKL
jgi:hypothetical protein